MRVVTFLTAMSLFMFFVCGCATTESQNASKGEIIPALASRHRDATNIALWTLEKNGFAVPKIDFEKSYSEAKPKLKQLIEKLEQLPQPKLTKLDKSFKYHRGIYSPFWSHGGDGWTE